MQYFIILSLMLLQCFCYYEPYVFAGLFFHVVGEGVVNLASKAESVTDKENYIDFRLRLLGEPGKNVVVYFELL